MQGHLTLRIEGFVAYHDTPRNSDNAHSDSKMLINCVPYKYVCVSINIFSQPTVIIISRSVANALNNKGLTNEFCSFDHKSRMLQSIV